MSISIANRQKGNNFFTTNRLALISSFAAVYAVIRILPTFPMLGVSGSTFAAADIIAPLYGVILGPIIWPISVILGTFLGFLGRPPTF